MTWKRPPSRLVPPVPDGFVQHFIEGGYRRVERIYGMRNDALRKWMVMAGGERELKAKRRAYILKRRMGDGGNN